MDQVEYLYTLNGLLCTYISYLLIYFILLRKDNISIGFVLETHTNLGEMMGQEKMNVD